MPTSGTNVVFFGTEDFSLAALTALVDARYTVAVVVTKPDSPSGRGMHLHEPAVKTYAIQNNIRVLQPEKLTEIQDELSQIPDRIGVLSSFGKIIPQSMLDVFEAGIINIHPSLLPKYRGPSPIETALLNGDFETGVSLMKLVAQMDAGPVYVQKSITLTPRMTANDLYTLCAQTGSELLRDALPKIIHNELSPHEQDDARATYTKLLSKKDAHVDPLIMTAEQIDRHIRAFIQYPRTRLNIGGIDIIITRGSLEETPDSFRIDCANKTHLFIEELIAPSGKRMSGADFQRGYA